MLFLLQVVARLVLLLGFAAIPGLFVLRAAGFRYRSRLDLLLAVFAAGIAAASLCVYLLLLLNGYSVVTAWLILAGPTAAIAWQRRRTGRWLPERLTSEQKRRVTILDRGVAAAAGLLVAMSFLDSATSPLHTWDAAVAWDQWAVEWAQRANLSHASQGGYPQLLPMFSSLLYKTGGRFDPLPPEQYALHAFHPLLGLLLLAACLRAAELFELPAWGMLALVFGCQTLRAALTAGGADLLVTLLTFSAVLLDVGWRKGEWSGNGVPVLVLCLFGAAFTKLTGLFAMLVVLLARFRRPRPGLALLALPILLLAPFYSVQYASSREPIERMNPHELTFRLRPSLDVYRQAIQDSYAGASGGSRLIAAGGRILAAYSLPLAALFPAILALALGVACLCGPPLRPVGIAALAMLAVWYGTASYDLRNLLSAVPLFALCLTSGAARLFARLDRFPRARLAAAILCTLALGAAGLRAALPMLRVRYDLPARLTAAEAGFPERARLFFPEDAQALNFLASQGLLARASHVFAVSYLYRWLPNGIYPASDWDRQLLAPGDLFIAPPSAELPERVQWTRLGASGNLQIFVAAKLIR